MPYKTKKWAIANVFQLFKLQLTNGPCVKNLAHLFKENYLKDFSICLINLLLKRANNYVITPKIILLSLKYLFFTLKKEDDPKIIENYENLIYNVFIPTLYITKTDEIIWNEDPREYIYRYELDASFIVFKIKTKVLQLIELFCKQNENILLNLLEKIEKILDNSFLDPSIQTNVFLIKDAFFQILGYLSIKIMNNPLLSDKMEDFLKKYALPEFQNQIGFLKVRACKIFDEFGIFEFKDKNLVDLIIENIANCLLSNEIPVRYTACSILKPLIEEKEVQLKLRSIVPRLLELTLKLMDCIDNEEVVGFLESIIENFEEDITMYAYELLQHLINAFFKYTSKNELIQNSKHKTKKKYGIHKEDEKEMAATRCLETIKTILFAKINKDVYEKIFPSMISLFNFGFRQESSDFFQHILVILSQTVHGVENLPDDLLYFFPVLFYLCYGNQINNEEIIQNMQNLSSVQKTLLLESFSGWAGFEFLETMLGAFAAFFEKLKGNIFVKNDLFQNPFISLVIKLEKEKDKESVESSDKLLLQHIYILVLENSVEIPEGFIEFLVEKCFQDLKNYEQHKKIKIKALETVNIEKKNVK